MVVIIIDGVTGAGHRIVVVVTGSAVVGRTWTSKILECCDYKSDYL